MIRVALRRCEPSARAPGRASTPRHVQRKVNSEEPQPPRRQGRRGSSESVRPQQLIARPELLPHRLAASTRRTRLGRDHARVAKHFAALSVSLSRARMERARPGSRDPDRRCFGVPDDGRLRLGADIWPGSQGAYDRPDVRGLVMSISPETRRSANPSRPKPATARRCEHLLPSRRERAGIVYRIGVALSRSVGVPPAGRAGGAAARSALAALGLFLWLRFRRTRSRQEPATAIRRRISGSRADDATKPRRPRKEKTRTSTRRPTAPEGEYRIRRGRRGRCDAAPRRKRGPRRRSR